MDFQVKVDLRSLQAIGQAFPRAGASALNKMASQAKTRASVLLRQEYNMTKREVDSRIEILRAKPETLNAHIRVESGRFFLYGFAARPAHPPTPHGVTVMVRKGKRVLVKGREPLSAGFVAEMQSGHIGIFQRTGIFRPMKRGRYKGKVRETIKEAVTLSLPEMFKGRRILPQINEFIRTKLPDMLAHEVQYFLGRR